MHGLLLHDILRTAAIRTPRRPAVSLGDRVVTFAEAEQWAAHLAAVLQDRGVRPGDRLGWWADTAIESGSLYSAIARLGAIFVPMNPRFSPAELGAALDVADPRLVITDPARAGEGRMGIDELMAAPTPSTMDLPEVDEHDPDVIFFTSGTTGDPKGVVLSHRCNRLRIRDIHLAPTGPVSSMFPQFHWGGWSFFHDAWYSSNEFVLCPSTAGDDLLAMLERRRIRQFYAIPGVWKRILEAGPEHFDTTALRYADTGTSALPEALLTGIRAAFGHADTRNAYGATEAGILAWLDGPDLERKPGSVGLPTPGLTTRLMDEELWVRSPQMSLGYWQNPEANAAAFTEDGWYRTGDRVHIDEDGYLYVRGRTKDLIRTGGEFVAPPEVDTVIQQHPAVADGAVAGVPDDTWGEVVAAFVVLRPGMTMSASDLRGHCETELARFKHPREVHIVDAIPRTGPTGQVQRRHLVDIAVRARASAANSAAADGRADDPNRRRGANA